MDEMSDTVKNDIESSPVDPASNAPSDPQAIGAADDKLNWQKYAPSSTVLTLQDLIDLPRQVLPEPTYQHLQNAGREAWLAVTSLVDSISAAVKEASAGQGEQKARRRISVE